jgi:energy-coupling factor transport system permease protein
VTSRFDPANLNPSLGPLTWPQLALLPMLGILAGLTPAGLAPLPADARMPVTA